MAYNFLTKSDGTVELVTRNGSLVFKDSSDTTLATLTTSGVFTPTSFGTVTSGTITTLTVTDIDAGASGTAGTVDVFPATASRGKLIISAANNTGNTSTTITNAAFGQASVLTISDPYIAAANIEPEVVIVDTITSAEILALHTTPIAIAGLAAPGANLAWVIDSVEARHAGGTAYANIAAGDDVELRYTDGSGNVLATIETTGFLDQTGAQIRHLKGSAVTPTANAAVVAHLPGAIDTGNFDLILRIRARIVPTNFA